MSRTISGCLTRSFLDLLLTAAIRQINARTSGFGHTGGHTAAVPICAFSAHVVDMCGLSSLGMTRHEGNRKEPCDRTSVLNRLNTSSTVPSRARTKAAAINDEVIHPASLEEHHRIPRGVDAGSRRTAIGIVADLTGSEGSTI